MKHRFFKYRPHAYCRGFASLEYCIVCALVVLVLFSNPGTPQMLSQAFQSFYRALTFYISLP